MQYGFWGALCQGHCASGAVGVWGEGGREEEGAPLRVAINPPSLPTRPWSLARRATRLTPRCASHTSLAVPPPHHGVMMVP